LYEEFKYEENSIICHYSINRRFIDATAQNKRYEKVLFVLTSHSELGDTGEKQGFGQKNLLLLITVSRQRVIIDIATSKGQPPIDQKVKIHLQLQRIPKDLTRH
jgi:hypothetical protein